MTPKKPDRFAEKAEAIARDTYMQYYSHRVEHIAKALRECAAEIFDYAANRCQTRATDAKLAKMPTILVRELELRRLHFTECAAALREKK